MQPSVEQLRKWAKVEGENGEWVRLPSSAWIDVLWILSVFEKIEDNPAVLNAFAGAAKGKTMNLEPPELTKQEQELMAFFAHVLEDTQSPLLIADAIVAVYEKWTVKEMNDMRLTQTWVSFKIKIELPSGTADELELAIWRNTGNVYPVTAGAVEEDPIIVITPPDMSGG